MRYQNKSLMTVLALPIFRTNYPPGSVTIYGMNLYDTPVTVTMGAQFKGQLIHEYLLTPFDQFWGIAAK